MEMPQNRDNIPSQKLFVRRSLLARLFRITQEVQRGTYPDIASLSRILEVSRRTVNRYIEALRDDFGAPILYSKKYKGYYFEKSWPFPLVDLSQGEALALFLSLSVVEQFRGTPLEHFFASLEEKLKIALPEEYKMSEKEFAMLFSPFLSPLMMKVDVKDVFDKIFQAIDQRRRILLRYFSFSSHQETERKVDPYHLYNFEGVWYFCGFCHLRREIRDFALDRVREVTILAENFVRPSDFSPREYFAQAFRLYHGETLRVRIWFDPEKAPWIQERIWHPTQEIQELPDGSVIFTVRAHPEEIKRWVLGYGSHARVLEPESFRKEIQEEIERMRGMYQEGEP